MLDSRLGEIGKMLLRRLPRRHRFIGVLIFQLIEREGDAIGKPHCLLDGFRQIAKQPRHLITGLHMPLGIGLQLSADGMDGGFLKNAGQHILQRPPLRMVIQHLVGCEQRHTCGCGNPV